jgi:hypothetical protein
LGNDPFWKSVLRGNDGNIYNQHPPQFVLESLNTVPPPPPLPPPEAIKRIFSKEILGHDVQGRQFFFDVLYSDDSRDERVELRDLVNLPPDGLDEIDNNLLAYLCEHRQLNAKGCAILQLLSLLAQC